MTPPSPHRLFAYGTLEIPQVMEALAGRRLAAEDAVLPGYARLLLRDRPYPGIVARAGARTAGRLYHGIDDEILALLDRFEGEPYQRLALSVRGAAGHTRSAQAYVIPAQLQGLLGGRSWSRERFVARHLGGILRACRELRRAALQLEFR